VFQVGEFTFRTKGQAIERLRAILRAAPIDAEVTGEDGRFVRAALDMHPNARQKIAGGVKRIVVRLGLPGGCRASRQFRVVRYDDSETSFSYKACFRTTEVNARRKVHQACRWAVVDATQAFKRRWRERDRRCAATGRPLRGRDAQVDHDDPWPFARIVDEWLGTLPAPPVLAPDPATGIDRIASPILASSFRRFHDERAVLRVVHKAVNNSKPRPRHES
jgi:hypothetical protein